MVVFRLTQAEYASLREACKTKGGRSISEFTRSELLAMNSKESIAGIIQQRFQDLEERIAQLDCGVTHLAEILVQFSRVREPLREGAAEGEEL